MFDVQILIPIVGNDGVAFDDAHFAIFEDRARSEFGGCSLLPGTVFGSWRNADGVVFHDESRLYSVFLVSLTEGAKLGALVEFAKAHFAQEAIAIRYLGFVEIL